MDKTKLNYVYMINGDTAVIADTITEAIKLYEEHYEYPYNEVRTVEKMTAKGRDLRSITPNQELEVIEKTAKWLYYRQSIDLNVDNMEKFVEDYKKIF